MKVAICISGHLRHFKNLKENFYSFKKLLQEFYHVDTFIATWDKQNTTNSWSHAHGISNASTANQIINKKEIQDFYETDFVECFDYDFYSSDFSPLKYTDWTDNKYSWDHKGISNNILNSSKMFFLIKEANDLKKRQEFKQNKKYDLVIRARPDYEYNDISIFKSLNIKENTIYVADRYPIDDQFAFGDSESMDKYASCIMKQSSIFNRNIWGDPERVLIHSIKDFHQINIDLIHRVGCLGSDVYGGKR